jgi:sarcosine oxidase subunit gamma
MSDAAAIAPAAPRAAAGITAFRDHEALRTALHAEFGIAPPSTPRFVQAGPVTLSCVSPTRYFVTAPPDVPLAAMLTKSLSGLAAITDQSDQWAIFALAGADIREMLARIVPVELTPAKFPVGALALTRAGHLDVRLWRIAEEFYELAVTCSCADDLRHALGLAK